MKSWKILLLVLLLAVSCGKKPTADLMITSGSIIDVNTGKIETGKSILIQGDSILAVVDDVDTLQQYPVKRISAKGRYLLPGLWDMHVHFGGGDTLIDENKNLLPLYIAFGITTVRDAAADLSPSVLQWRREINENKLLGPTLFTSGPKLEGIKSVWIGDLEVGTVEEMRAAMDSLQQMKVDFIKITDNTLKPELYMESVREAKKRGLRISGHVPFALQLEEVSASGLSSVEHIGYFMKAGSTRDKEITAMAAAGKITYREALPLLAESFDYHTAFEVYRRIAQNGTAVIPTMNIGRTLAYLDTDHHENDGYLKYIGKGLQKTYEGRVIRAAGDDAKAIDNRHMQFEKSRTLLPLLQLAGVHIIAGTDAGYLNSFVYPGIALHEELQIFTASGLTPLQALQSAILEGPAYFGKSDQYGSLSPGRKADVLMLSENPLKDIKATQSIEAVVTHGKLFNRKALDSLLVMVEQKAQK